MPGWGAEVYIQVLFGVITAVIAILAFRRSGAANEIARQALRVQEREAEATISSELRRQSADLFTRSPKLSAKNSAVQFWVENYGPHDAYEVALTLHHDDMDLLLDKYERIAAGRAEHFSRSVRPILLNLSSSTEQHLKLRATYRDGTGPRSTEWDVTLPPGNRFADREWTLMKVDDSRHQ